MNFSKFNEGITYSFTWGGPLIVCGKGKVCDQDLDVVYDRGKGRRWTDEYSRVAFEKGITEVGEGFLEGFRNLKELVIPRTVKSIGVTPELQKLLKKNNVLVRGWYDSYGEKFAAEHGLRFLHANIVVGWYRDEEHDMGTHLEIRFTDKGKAYRFYDDVCQGISAGNNGGGTYERELDDDWFVGETLESLAEWLTRFREPILKNDDLGHYLKTANKRFGKKKKK